MNENKTKDTVIVDIDGTISKVGERLKYLKQDPPDWDSFYADCFEDEPVPEIIKMVDDLYEEYNRIVFCTGIGKNTGDGWGQVKNWEVTEWPEDWSIRGFNNKLMRNVPLKDQEGRGFLYGVRPSYWNTRHQFLCKMPE